MPTTGERERAVGSLLFAMKFSGLLTPPRLRTRGSAAAGKCRWRSWTEAPMTRCPNAVTRQRRERGIFAINPYFTHICGKKRNGRYAVVRQTIRRRLQAKLSEVKAELRRR